MIAEVVFKFIFDPTEKKNNAQSASFYKKKGKMVSKSQEAFSQKEARSYTDEELSSNVLNTIIEKSR